MIMLVGFRAPSNWSCWKCFAALCSGAESGETKNLFPCFQYA